MCTAKTVEVAHFVATVTTRVSQKTVNQNLQYRVC